jgi:hypothetical protein
LFAQSRPFLIPTYQRAYSWQDEEVGRLFEDLRNAYEAKRKHYFLGTVVLIVDRPAGADVVDGQQRLATLSLLAAALRDRLAASLPPDAPILERLQAVLSGPRGARLLLRKSDHAFWAAYVEAPGRFADLCAIKERTPLDRGGAPDAQPLMVRAAQTLSLALDQAHGLDIEAFARHVLRVAQFNVIETDERDTAPHMFTVLNNTGLDLSAADLVKSELLLRAQVDDAEATELAALWEEKVDLIGRKGMNDLFSALPFLMSPSDSSNRPDARAQEWSVALMHVTEPRRFLQEDIHRYVRAFYTIMEANAEYGNFSREINRRLKCLAMVTDRTWLAPAIWVLSDPAAGKDGSFVRDYLMGLERFAFACHTAAIDSGSRVARLRAILRAGSDRKKLFDFGTGALELRGREALTLIDKMCAPPKREHKRRRLVVFRVNAALGDVLDPGRDDATVEHILPTKASGEWLRLHPDPQLREQMADWLGNLTLVTTRQNELAGDKVFERKKPIFFDDVSPVRALTRDLRDLSRWGPEELRARHNRLRTALINEWGIRGEQLRL